MFRVIICTPLSILDGKYHRHAFVATGSLAGTVEVIHLENLGDGRWELRYFDRWTGKAGTTEYHAFVSEPERKTVGGIAAEGFAFKIAKPYKQQQDEPVAAAARAVA